MADKDPIETVKDGLKDAPEVPSTETAKEKDETAVAAKVDEREGERLRNVDENVTKLCEDMEKWKQETHLETEALKESIRELSEKLAEPRPVQPQNPPPVDPVEPLDPQQPPESTHPSGAGVRKDQRIKRAVKAEPQTRRRFL